MMANFVKTQELLKVMPTFQTRIINGQQIPPIDFMNHIEKVSCRYGRLGEEATQNT